ncbi:hypothetical protein WN48_04942 [Eufriesea mexicana]|uniref:Uncharacterized protein n=1 Tax=Eufriesea mexicana TaxID=516756 RepID=A0A310SNE8_9HYME|nr:hypothetical protein WN48_04942 [Eufriesea mexicana]
MHSAATDIRRNEASYDERNRTGWPVVRSLEPASEWVRRNQPRFYRYSRGCNDAIEELG